MLRYAVCHVATEAVRENQQKITCAIGSWDIGYFLLYFQCHSSYNHFHAKIQGCKTHLTQACKGCEFLTRQLCNSGQCIHTGREIQKEQEN